MKTLGKKILFMLSGFLFSLFLISFVSAGLCKANDGYYYDCNYNSYSNWQDWGDYNVINLNNWHNSDVKNRYYKKNYNDEWQKDYQDIHIIYYPASRARSSSRYTDLDYKNKIYKKRYNNSYYYGYHKGFKKGYNLGYDDGGNRRDSKLIFEPSYPEYLVYEGRNRDGEDYNDRHYSNYNYYRNIY